MVVPLSPRIKICCIGSIDEAQTVIDFGASAIGLVGKMPGGPGIVSDELIAEIAAKVPPPIGTFLLTSETSAEKIIQHYKSTLTNTIQIVDKSETGAYSIIKQELPAIKLVQVIHIVDERSVDEAIELSEQVHAILLDSGNPKPDIKELGGTGRIHNWKLSRDICEKVNVPVFLAGGLNSENVKNAFNEVQPFGIDVCSGVRTNGKLDKRKLEKFFHELIE